MNVNPVMSFSVDTGVSVNDWLGRGFTVHSVSRPETVTPGESVAVNFPSASVFPLIGPVGVTGGGVTGAVGLKHTVPTSAVVWTRPNMSMDDSSCN